MIRGRKKREIPRIFAMEKIITLFSSFPPLQSRLWVIPTTPCNR